ncbi:MAG TPA: response regulator [Accumulibacter sp.]|uniref:response regulator n=1 Tax=Accumulibacter sp. TaxID=2053492 RepID=UPI002BE042CF|nr:response regulator [Accumulibacter sp.]HMV04270.1 response regulator [Accumulibacter sp.]HMW62979.1 response regulator [Accumulibacter sp.]HNB66859.1 response regulator [Accumulibacter sp.]HNE39087.1 response regulator [Accumulibacter sp.]HNG15588.1 response regulator [Accumulibacter sp.]
MSAMLGRVLIVEDEPRIRRFVRDALGREGCETFEAGNVGEGLEMAGAQHPDLIVLDLGLPDQSGLELIRKLRAWSSIPVLILSARIAEQDKVTALDAGADDYLTKPFGVAELLARVRALLRRRQQEAQPSPVRRFGDVVVDLSRRVVQRSGCEIHLTQLEYGLLATLLANDGKVLTHRQLLREVWGEGYAGQSHYLKVYVSRLRQKLEPNPTQPRFLLTETGVGYRFQS